MTLKSILNIFKLTTRYQILLFYNFVVTFVMFPGIVASVVSLHHGSIFYDKIFVSIMCFLVFNVGDFFGRTLCEYLNWPLVTSKFFTLLCLLRAVFIPLFLICNIQPHISYMPNIFGDYWFMGFMFVFSITNGYFVTKIMIYAPR
jgi:equilibrative nucleoside transporter 1/2/3